MTPPSSPKGSLEELFRHHLLESEAAAVPPFPHVWEQLDNSLLIAQNVHYRRRLQAYRWAMVASLLLAMLAGGGWWRSQAGQGASLAGAARIQAIGTGSAINSRSPTGQLGLAATSTIPSPATAYSIDNNTTLFSCSAPVGLGTSPAFAASGRFTLPANLASNFHYSVGSSAWQIAGLAAPGHKTYPAVASVDVGTADRAAALLMAAEVASFQPDASQLAARLASLQLPASALLPTRLGATATPMLVSNIRPLRPWQLQVAYTAGVYDPNIDFQKAPADYDASLGPGTVATTRDAAAEYRHHLRPGLSQRLGVWATRRLGIGRWNLRTGLEVAQNEASSSSSVAFVGEQVATLNPVVQVQSNKLQTTTYRYRSVGVPVEVNYISPLRRGFALYGHVGTLFSALLNVRSEVAGDPEATRVYSYQSPGSPYRQLLTNVRGGVGMHYQPSRHQWSLNLGPVAEAGVLSLNNDPTQDFWNQRRPYSIGLEAGVEFSSLLKPSISTLVP